MLYNVVILRRALKSIQRLPVAQANRIFAAIQALSNDPRPLGCEKLKDRSALWRIREGDYRIIYTINEQELLVTVVKVGHRRDVYR